MKLYGYDANSQVIVTHLSPEEIAESGIDPWRLDLMDKDPTTLGDLRFSRLSDVAFAYRTKDRQTFLGLHDGKDPVCFTGEEHGSTIGEIRLRNVRLSERKFGDHFAEYLQHRIVHSAGFCMEIADSHGNFAVTVEADAPGDDSADLQAPAGYQAKPASAILVRGGTVTFTDCDTKSLKSLEPGIFRGDMFAERIVPFKLPAEIGWIFEALAGIPAFVIGKELRQALAGEKVDSVSFMIDRDDLAAVKSRLLPHGLVLGPANMNAYKLSLMSFAECPLGEPFQHGLCTYRLHVSKYSRMSQRLIENVNLRTAESIYAASPFELRGSRIAFADLAKKRARLLRYNHPWTAGSSFEESALSKEGFTEF